MSVHTITWSNVPIEAWQKYTLGAPAVHKIPEGYVTIEMYNTSRNEGHKPVRGGACVNQRRKSLAREIRAPVYRSTVQTVVKKTMENATKPNRSLPMKNWLSYICGQRYVWSRWSYSGRCRQEKVFAETAFRWSRTFFRTMNRKEAMAKSLPNACNLLIRWIFRNTINCVFYDYLRHHLELLPFRYVHFLIWTSHMSLVALRTSVTLCRCVMPLRYAVTLCRYVLPLRYAVTYTPWRHADVSIPPLFCILITSGPKGRVKHSSHYHS